MKIEQIKKILDAFDKTEKVVSEMEVDKTILQDGFIRRDDIEIRKAFKLLRDFVLDTIVEDNATETSIDELRIRIDKLFEELEKKKK